MKKTYVFASLAILLGSIIIIAFLNYYHAQKTYSFSSIDHILVEKNKRLLSVYLDGTCLKTYKIALGFSPIGHKEKEGDGKTPEGRYTISHRNPKAAFICHSK